MRTSPSPTTVPPAAAKGHTQATQSSPSASPWANRTTEPRHPRVHRRSCADWKRGSNWAQEVSFEHKLNEQVAVAVVVEQHRHLISVVALNGTFAPSPALDADANGERFCRALWRCAEEVVVADAAANGRVRA